jgi:aspartate/methionine/tyrosine aminotransferase
MRESGGSRLATRRFGAGWRPAGSVAFPRLIAGDADRFAAAPVEREGVLLLPGSRFGYPGSHFRIGFGRVDMRPALERVDSFLQREATA